MNTGSYRFYKRVARPVLFRVPPETAHAATAWLLRRRLVGKLIRTLAASYEVGDQRLQVRIAGLDFPSPVGLAAGYDKNCEIVASIMSLGFGYVVGGTVLLGPRAGNPSPRLVRLPQKQSLINSMGFPSKGAEAVQRTLERLEHRLKPLVVSLSGLTPQELVTCHMAMEPLADATEINISSPNTAALGAFQEPDAFADLVERINGYRSKPLFVKLPFYSDSQGQERVLALVRVARQHGVDAVTTSNASLVEAPMLATGRGGLSGKALFQDTLRIVSEVRAEAGDGMAINGCGGIFTAEDAFQVLEAGADTVQLLTALIYEGPAAAAAINRGLLRLLERSSVSSVQQLTCSARMSAHAAPVPSLTDASL